MTLETKVQAYASLSAPALLDASATVRKLSTVESCRAAAGISQQKLANTAGINPNWYSRILREPHRASPRIVAKAEAALRRLKGETEAGDPLIHSLYGGFLVAICPFYGVTPTQVRAALPQQGHTGSARWMACAHARQAALYLTHTVTHTALGLTQRRLAAALAVTPAAVCLALQSVENRRDDPAFNAALDAAQRDVTGVLQ